MSSILFKFSFTICFAELETILLKSSEYCFAT
jgi:hypothetical protein